MSAKVTVKKLQKKYPDPQIAISGSYGGYCIGGALCREAKIDSDYPSFVTVRDAVSKLNPSLNIYSMSNDDQEKLRRMCEEIITLNDSGAFLSAWRVVAELLEWEPPDIFATYVTKDAI